MPSNFIVIDPQHITVVIQGPMYRNLAPISGINRCIASIRKHLPGAEIVVSTWGDESVVDLSGCKVVVSEAPPAFFDISGKQINTNRLIRSTRVGIERATRKYVLKFRADHFLESPAITFVREYDDSVAEQDRLLKCPITITNLFVRNPARMPMLFHLSDTIQFGLREDMLKIWAQDLLTEEEHFIKSGPLRNPFGNFIGRSNLRVVPEQAIAIGWLRRSGLDISLDHVCHVTSEMLIFWEQVLVSNFNVMDWQKTGIHYPRRFFISGPSLKTVYSSAELEKTRKLSAWGRYVRRCRVWLNQYVFACFSPAWIINAISILLFSFSPNLAKNIRIVWRRFKKSR